MSFGVSPNDEVRGLSRVRKCLQNGKDGVDEWKDACISGQDCMHEGCAYVHVGWWLSAHTHTPDVCKLAADMESLASCSKKCCNKASRLQELLHLSRECLNRDCEGWHLDGLKDCKRQWNL